MRVRAITPIRVTDDELQRRQDRYSAVSPAGVEVDVVNLPQRSDAPARLETDADISASDRLVLDEALRTDDTYDVVLPDCVLDPGVHSGGPPAVPIVGILQLSAGFLHALGRPFAAVTRNKAIGEELVARLRHYGLDDLFAGLEVLDLDFEAISDDQRWHEALRPVRERTHDGVAAIINGCSAVDVPSGDGSGAAVIDPTRLALELLAVAAHSQVLRTGSRDGKLR